MGGDEISFDWTVTIEVMPAFGPGCEYARRTVALSGVVYAPQGDDPAEFGIEAVRRAMKEAVEQTDAALRMEADRREAAEAEAERYREALYNAEAFIVTVQKWMGGPDDMHEALDDLRAALNPEEK